LEEAGSASLFSFHIIKEYPMAHDCSRPVIDDGIYSFDARGVARRFRHAAIFGALAALNEGETMRFCNDHDPLPLLAQIADYFGERVKMSYVSREPGEIVIDFLVTSN
jgi:uncharacterized protein (DUF2249 family)